MRDDQDGAEAIGIDSRLYKVIARCLMAAIFAAGGTLYGFWALAVFPEKQVIVRQQRGGLRPHIGEDQSI